MMTLFFNNAHSDVFYAFIYGLFLLKILPLEAYTKTGMDVPDDPLTIIGTVISALDLGARTAAFISPTKDSDRDSEERGKNHKHKKSCFLSCFRYKKSSDKQDRQESEHFFGFEVGHHFNRERDNQAFAISDASDTLSMPAEVSKKSKKNRLSLLGSRQTYDLQKTASQEVLNNLLDKNSTPVPLSFQAVDFDNFLS